MKINNDKIRIEYSSKWGEKMNIYVILLSSLSKPMNQEIILKHVNHLKKLDSSHQLILCGPFSDHPSGIVIIHAKDLPEATQIALSDPFVKEGYRSFEIRTLEVANKENNYLL